MQREQRWQIMRLHTLHAWNLSDLHVLNISFPSLWPHSDVHPRAIIYLSCQSSLLEFRRVRSKYTRVHTPTHKWYRYGSARKLHDEDRIALKQRTWEGEKKDERTVSFIWYHNRSQRGGVCCSRCGMAEKIGKEHGVAEINRKAAVWKAPLSFSLLNPYWQK